MQVFTFLRLTPRFHQVRLWRNLSTGVDSVQAQYLQERCILVNAKDEVVGSETKGRCHRWDAMSRGGSLHRAFSVFLFNGKQELLLQKRAAAKVTFPGVWTNACCSHPLHTAAEMEVGDALGVRRAAQRKLCHELGFAAEQVTPESLHWLTRVRYKARSDAQWGEHELDYVLWLRSDAPPSPNPQEVDETRFVDQQQLRRMLDDGQTPFSPWFSLIARQFLFDWWDNLSHLHDFVDHSHIHVLNWHIGAY